MYLPQLTQKRAQQAVTSVFKGLNRAQEIGDGEFAREMNLSTREFPMMCPRKPRGVSEAIESTYRGMMEKNGKLVTIQGSAVHYGGDLVEGLTLSEAPTMLPKRLVGMGAYVVIFPDKVYFNSVDLTDCGSLEASYESTGTVTYAMCRLDGSDFGRVSQDKEAPENPENGDYWIDVSSTPHKLMVYSSLTGVWTAVQTVYTRIGASGIGANIKAGDTVEIGGISIDAYVPDGSTRTAGPDAHMIIYDADEGDIDALTVTYTPQQTGSGTPDAYNVRHFIGKSGVNVTISPTAQESQGETIEADWESTTGTLYGWTYNALTGVLTQTHGRIASYDSETDSATIAGRPWLSSMDEYVEGGEPTDGAEVVYELETATTYSLTAAEPETSRGTNHIWTDAGTLEIEYLYYDPNYETAKEQAEALNGSQYVYDVGEDWITVVGVLDESVEQNTGKITAERKCPDMECIIESDNRIWGCHYGSGSGGEMLNEIYACKLGDFKNWRVYQGISTDSYAVSIGSDGPFTGAAAFGGMPMFFKANCVHKIYGSQPKNYQIMTTQLPGVQSGSGESMAIVDGTLFYLSGSGVMAYDGSYPVRMSMALGDEPMSAGKAGTVGGRYYIQVTQDQQSRMYVYDPKLAIWHEEDAPGAIAFAEKDGDLYIMTEKRLITVLGSVGTKETAVNWYAETGLQGWEQFYKKVMSAGDDKYITRFYIRTAAQAGSAIRCKLQYEGEGRWTEKMNLVNYGAETSTKLMPVYPKRCDHMKMRLEGEGDVKIHSIIRTISGGGGGKRG